MDNASKTVLDALKTASKKVVHKAPEGKGVFIGIKIADKIVKPKSKISENSRNAKEIVTPSEKW